MVLEIEQGPNAGERWTLVGPEITIGRDAANDIDLEDARVSQYHCRLWRAGDDWWIHDLDSTNGTWVNDQRLKGTQRLEPGDQLRVGLTYFSLAFEPGSVSPEEEVSSGSADHKAAPLSAPGTWARSDAPLRDATRPQASQNRGMLAAVLTDGLVLVAALMLIIAADLTWIRIGVDVPFVGELGATAAGTVGLGKYTATGGTIALALSLMSLIARALVMLKRESPSARYIRPVLRWNGLGYLLVAATLLLLGLVGLWRYYQSASREVFLGIRLIDLFDFAANWLDLQLTPQTGLILTGVGLGLLLLAAVMRLASAALLEKPVRPAAQEPGVPRLFLQQTAGRALVFPVYDGVTLGRGEDNDIVVEDEHASRYHAEIRQHDGEFFIADRQSTNGVRVNDQRITAPHRLTPDDQIQIGRMVFKVRSEDEATPAVQGSAVDSGYGDTGTHPSADIVHQCLALRQNVTSSARRFSTVRSPQM
jgi:pSer/pThr/pTyr-binding forkhead associated (FHA) protein